MRDYIKRGWLIMQINAVSVYKHIEKCAAMRSIDVWKLDVFKGPGIIVILHYYKTQYFIYYSTSYPPQYVFQATNIYC